MASEEENRLAMERDLAVRQAKLAEADLKVIQMALNENRPLEALRTVNNSLDRLDEELDALEEIERAREDDDGADSSGIPPRRPKHRGRGREECDTDE